MNRPGRNGTARRWIACSALVAVGVWAISPAIASDEQTWREECGGCHVAYPARLLPKTAWDEIMRTLPDHYGTDASVDEPTATAIRRYLDSSVRHRTRPRPNPPELRITKSRWFVDEHDDVPRARWRSEAVGSPANCAACHPGAEQGRFNEDSVKLP